MSSTDYNLAPQDESNQQNMLDEAYQTSSSSPQGEPDQPAEQDYYHGHEYEDEQEQEHEDENEEEDDQENDQENEEEDQQQNQEPQANTDVAPVDEDTNNMPSYGIEKYMHEDGPWNPLGK